MPTAASINRSPRGVEIQCIKTKMSEVNDQEDYVMLLFLSIDGSVEKVELEAFSTEQVKI